MTYSYSFYSKNFFELPMLFLIVLLPTLIYTIIYQIRRILRTKNYSGSSLVPAIVSILVIFGFVFNNAATLLSGGIWLYKEREADAVCVQGTVTRVEQVGKYEVEIWVDREVYLASDTGDFQEGDLVQLEYLPKSKFVLSVEII